MASESRELAQRSAVDPEEEPSAEWGWHGSFPKGSLIAGWVVTVLMFVLLIGNHTGRTEDIWLIGTGVLMAAALVWQTLRKRNAWRR
ncbi:DUF2631 domain-containing protein [Pseudonocardia abyssalis]|jgi:hypothetical protein|uniref:DUF2631 domain-containing protein n=1 Tax=Pseudonocardia abyssalis TaxID=2792008 RepID=A0ABS6UKK8_9PSEU|nr:DUF2631 domain-containing protein [Pseudonocardia abyssalis]MBW0116175.1 DUF2631 domain-containing protein [Pseudonocardia abyssalis]MBW0132768.1 DUF2631 domain-containing protein [Pseudonocardia abyssalis]